MPYVHQKTWVQLAPKIRNLSLKESPWGFGQYSATTLTPQEVAWQKVMAAQLVPGGPTPSGVTTPFSYPYGGTNWLQSMKQQRSVPVASLSQPANWAAAEASQRGFGQAPFPATPCYDDSGNVIDCAGSSAGLTIVNPLPGQDTYTGYSLPATSSPSPSPSTTNSLAAWFQANQSMVLLGGAALFGLALISGMGRR